MTRTISMALQMGVRVGAHPSFADREGFGRRSSTTSFSALIDALKRQVSDLMEVAARLGVEVQYIKPHGALYNEAARGNSQSAEAVIAVARHFNLDLMMLANSPLARSGKVAIVAEGFIDRGYDSTGLLIPRSESGAVIEETEEAALQAVRLASKVDSLCIHSDNPAALALTEAAIARLMDAGYTIGA